MERIFIGFNKRHSSLFSKLIRFFSKSGWSHVFFVLDTKFDKDYLTAEACFHGGVKFDLFSKYTKDSNVECEVYELLNVKPEDIKAALKPFIGVHYGIGQIVGFLIAKLFRLKRNPITKGVVCSEFVLIGLREAFYNDFKHLDADTVKPEDIYLLVKNSTNFNKINKLY